MLFWFALILLVPREQIFHDPSIRKPALWLFFLLVVQLIYGAFMAGLKAAMAAPTWPKINDAWIPKNIYSFGGRHFSGLSFLTDHPLVIHFIHRTLAYIITVLILFWWWKARKKNAPQLFTITRAIPVLIVCLQLILGILTVLNPGHPSAFLWLAAAHQLVAMLLLLSLVWILFIVRKGNNQYFY